MAPRLRRGPEALFHLMVLSIGVTFVLAWALLVLTLVHEVAVELYLQARKRAEERYRCALMRKLGDERHSLESPTSP